MGNVKHLWKMPALHYVICDRVLKGDMKCGMGHPL